MKLADHVLKIKTLISQSFVNEFQRIGIYSDSRKDISSTPESLYKKRKRLDEIIESHISETGGYKEAYEKIIDEYTFTLFNRIAALKVMEAQKLFPEVITKRAENGNRSFQHRAWLEEKPAMMNAELEGLWEFIRDTFNQLSSSINLYSKNYTYALLPSPIELNNIVDAFNVVETDDNVDSSFWQSDDVIGWLYESYNNTKKQTHKDSGDKTEFDKVSLQSQVYTPRWVVEFLVNNSLGKLYLEMYPGSEIKSRYKIANVPQTRAREPKPLHEVKLIDPASGSGNFLLYAFILFYELYIDQIENYGANYDEDDIPKLIIENNLHGIDLDDRAVQLAQLGLWIKAKQKNRNISELKFNIVSSDFYLPEFETVLPIFEIGVSEDYQLSIIKEIWADLQQAYKFGSLIKLEEKLSVKLPGLVKSDTVTFFDAQVIDEYERFKNDFFVNLEKAISQYAMQKGNSFLTDKTMDAITFLKLLSTKYDVATANPPYTDSSDYGPELKQFIENNYKKPLKFHTNLYASFIKRNYELTDEHGIIAMIHPHTFMFIKSFEDVRKLIIENTHIDVLVDFGLDRVNLFGPGILVEATFYVLSKLTNQNEGLYFNLTTNLQEKFKKGKFLEALDDFINNRENDRAYTLAQPKLKIIKSWPFIYWISDEFREKFKIDSLEKYFKVSQGMSVSNSERFLRFHWEVFKIKNHNDSNRLINKWVRFPKGGPFKKWSGNLWLTVNWANNGKELKSYRKAVLRNQPYYFRRGLTYSSSGSKGTTFRVLPSDCVISGGGPGIHQLLPKYSLEYCLGYLNSKFSSYIINCLNPTVNTTQGDLNRIPILSVGRVAESVIEKCVDSNILLSEALLSFNLIEGNFNNTPLKCQDSTLINSITEYLCYENYLNTLNSLNQALIDKNILENISLPANDKENIYSVEGESIGALPVSLVAKQEFLKKFDSTKEFSLDIIKDFIRQLPENEFHIEERETIENEFSNLYQNNNDLEEFCIRHHVNPINVWYWFKQSNVVPKQRAQTIAMEFLADLIREILNEDEDGIAPLVRNSGEEILLERIEKKFLEKGFSLAQYSSFPSILGKEINDYLFNNFFTELSDHLNLFMYLPKTPFIWHLTSGPNNGFDCYIIIYKWSRDKLSTIKSVYLQDRESSLRNRQSDLLNDNSAKAQNEKDLIYKQLKEISGFKQKIDELLAEGYSPTLDDGVGKNIAPLQKKGILAYEVLNAGQLKKYLNADW